MRLVTPRGVKGRVMSTIAPAGQPEPLRILLANLPAIMAEWLTQIVGDRPDLQIVGQIDGYADLLLAAQDGVDVVVLGVHEFSPVAGICSHLLTAEPDIRIVLLSPSGDRAALYWLALRRRELANLSAATLLETLQAIDLLTPVYEE